MKLEPWEPDLQSLAARIEDGDLDLQPDFQRGVAWGEQKQQRLVDTVLRGWAVPAVHLLVRDDGRLDVLDGQQRLHSLMLFLTDRLRVNGRLEPLDPRLEAMHGYFFSELPDHVQRQVRNFKIPAYRLYEYDAAEPYELFFRLNLPTGLTPAEKRNALVGDNHAAVRHLVSVATDQCGWSKSLIGFSNARLAYDDAIARLCTYLERGSLRVSMTASTLESVYRSDEPFGDATVGFAEAAIERLTTARSEASPALNKATLITWLLVAARIELEDLPVGELFLADLVEVVESSRISLRRGNRSEVDERLRTRAALAYLEVFNDRASSRVTDTLSVLARDASAWMLAASALEREPMPAGFAALSESLGPVERAGADIVGSILEILEHEEIWGQLNAAG